MPNNELATQHYLNSNDQIFFKYRVEEINKRIERIVAENALKGKWTLSTDLKWLIFVEE